MPQSMQNTGRCLESLIPWYVLTLMDVFANRPTSLFGVLNLLLKFLFSLNNKLHAIFYKLLFYIKTLKLVNFVGKAGCNFMRKYCLFADKVFNWT